MHLIMPMGGAGSRFYKDGYRMPKPLIEIEGKPFFYWATNSVAHFMNVDDITFVVLKEHVDKFDIDKAILKYFPLAKLIIIPKVLEGAVLTCMEGVKNINDDDSLLFNDCDHAFVCRKFYDFNGAGLDGALLTFKSKDPRYSFLEMDADGNVIRTVEKQAISDNAICGAYYFKDKNTFMKNAIRYLDECDYSEYFMSGVYNVMAKEGLKIGNFTCDEHLSFGTPEEFLAAKGNEIFGRLA